MSFRELYGSALKVCEDVFGEDVRYFPLKGGPYTTRVIFDEQYLAVDPDTEELISANAPRVGVDLNQMKTAPEKGDEVNVQGRRWRVKDSQEDGLGGSTLMLQLLGKL